MGGKVRRVKVKGGEVTIAREKASYIYKKCVHVVRYFL